jgi:hypothetical protein
VAPVRLSRLRLGELLAVAGAVALAVLSFLPWYTSPSGDLTAWDNFGVVDVLVVAAVLVVLVLAITTVTERTPALPVASAVWTIVIGFVVSVAIAVALLAKPDHASGLQAGSWLSLLAGLAILAGGWQSIRDERLGAYAPVDPQARSVGS